MRILVVEDREEIASFISRGLREEGYAVDVAEDGRKGLSMGRVYTYDLIITDVMMPKLNGVEMVRELRNSGVQSPVLMLTVLNEVEDRVKGLDAGADDYLVKPFAFMELQARVRALLRRPEGQNKSTLLTVEDLALDTVKHAVYRSGERIDLTPREFALLEYLMRNSGRILSRSVLIDHVWDMSFDSDTNLVDVYIRYLRKKVDDAYDRKLIHTVRGVGYRLGDEK